MTTIINNFEYGSRTVTYTVQFAARKTLEISVLPDLRVTLTAPRGADPFVVHNKVLKRKKWIVKQLRYFEQFHPRSTVKKYVSGETFLYLGKQYRLKIIENNSLQVLLKNGRIIINIDIVSKPRTLWLLNKWYREKAYFHFNEILNRYIPVFNKRGLDVTNVIIKTMKTRWGSMSKHGTLTLNPNLIKAPKSAIEYVIVHELCHLKIYGHNVKFYTFLEKQLPDWKVRKHKLELLMA